MPDTLPNLSLPILQPSQAQKHVTHNAALSVLDALVQLSVISGSATTPPAAPQDGMRYAVPAGGQLDWAGQDGRIASFENGAWVFYAPQEGWRAYFADTQTLRLHDGAAWQDLSGGDLLEDLTGLGIGMDTASAPFSAKLNAALWTALYAADGGTGSLMQTYNKEAAGDDAGFVLQTDFVTRALFGLFGNNDLRLAVSQDGTSFQDGLVVDGQTGITSQPNLPRFSGTTNFDNFGAVATWTKIGINTLAYNDQGVFDAATNVFTAPVDGLYAFNGHLLFKIDANDKARMNIRLVKNGTDQIAGTFGRITSNHDTEKTFINTHALVPLVAGDTVELQGMFASFSGYFAANETSFFGYKVG
ncbi:MAG: DUF2793 domain-containing protein [Pseudomonadota bacterium]